MFDKKFKQSVGLLPKGTWLHFKDDSLYLYNGDNKKYFINSLKKDVKILKVEDINSLLEYNINGLIDWISIAEQYNGVLFLSELQRFDLKGQCYCNFNYMTEDINNNL